MINSAPFYFNQKIIEDKKRYQELSYNDIIVLHYLNYKLNIKDILTIDNESLSKDLSLSISTIKRAIKILKQLNLIKIKTTYNPNIKKNKREITKGQIDPLVKSKKSIPAIKKHYQDNKRIDNIAKGQNEPTINNNINNINNIKNNEILTPEQIKKRDDIKNDIRAMLRDKKDKSIY